MQLNQKRLPLKNLKFKLQNTKYKKLYVTSHTRVDLQLLVRVIHCTRRYFLLIVKNFQEICLHLKPNTTYFEIIHCILEFRFCIFEGQPFLTISCIPLDRCSVHICLQQFITTIHAIKTFVKLIVSARYVCIAYHSFPLHSVFIIKKEFFLSFR